MLGECDGLRGRLRAAVDDHGQRPGQEELGSPAPLAGREQDSLARRPERKEPVEAAAGEELEIRAEGVLVERSAVVAEWRDGSSKRSAEHGATLRSTGWQGCVWSKTAIFF